MCFGVSCGICAGAIVLTSRPSRTSVVPVAPVMRGRGRGRGRAVSVPAWFCVAVAWLRHADEC
nr:MAG TPA: hypothetical protein [Caudoviricetes sp.]